MWFHRFARCVRVFYQFQHVLTTHIYIYTYIKRCVCKKDLKKLGGASVSQLSWLECIFAKMSNLQWIVRNRSVWGLGVGWVGSLGRYRTQDMDKNGYDGFGVNCLALLKFGVWKNLPGGMFLFAITVMKFREITMEDASWWMMLNSGLGIGGFERKFKESKNESHDPQKHVQSLQALRSTTFDGEV